MKSFIWLQTADGSIQQVEEEVAMFCPMICREVLQSGMGSSKNYAITLPQRVNPAILGLILDYCRFHQLPGRSNKVCFWLLVRLHLYVYWPVGDISSHFSGCLFCFAPRNAKLMMKSSSGWIQINYVS